MSRSVSDALAELIAMKASGEITAEEFTAARDRLRKGDAARSSEGRDASSAPTFGGGAVATPQPSSTRTAEGHSAVPGVAAPKKPRRLRQVAGVMSALLLAILVLGSFGNKTVYKRADYGAAWPYPNHDTATVRCEVRTFGTTDRPIATVELGGVTYGLNGAARSSGKYPDSAPLEASEKAAIASTRQTMIDDALAKLCRWKQ